jgi:hypothetical protein
MTNKIVASQDYSQRAKRYAKRYMCIFNKGFELSKMTGCIVSIAVINPETGHIQEYSSHPARQAYNTYMSMLDAGISCVQLDQEAMEAEYLKRNNLSKSDLDQKLVYAIKKRKSAAKKEDKKVSKKKSARALVQQAK